MGEAKVYHMAVESGTRVMRDMGRESLGINDKHGLLTEPTCRAVFWGAVSILSAVWIIFLNKQLIKQLPAPFLMTAVQYIFMSVALEAMAAIGVFTRRSFPSNRQQMRVMLAVVIALAPATSNMSLQYNSVGTYQLFKTLQTPAIVLAEYLVQAKVVSRTRAVWLTGICAAVAVATVNDVELRMSGLVWAVAALLMAAVSKVSQAQLQQSKGVDCIDPQASRPWESLQLMHALLPLSSIVLVLLTCVNEREIVLNLVRQHGEHWHGVSTASTPTPQYPVWLLLFGSMALAFLVTLSQFKMTGLTSALTHSLVGQFKTASVIVGGFLFRSVVSDATSSAKQLGGASVALLCFYFYTSVTMNEKNKTKADQSQNDNDIEADMKN